MKIKHCPVCNKKISRGATYCHRCCELGERNYMFGKHSWNYEGSLNYCCMDCGGLISKPTALKGQGRCRSCSRKGELSWNDKIGLLHRGNKHHSWKGGLATCLDCGEILSTRYSKRCRSCDMKNRLKINPNYYKDHPFSFRFYKFRKCLMRSSWEVLFAKFLTFSGIKWNYEPKAFNLGNTYYIPDFYLPEFNCWIEVKGQLKRINKFNKLKKQINLKLFTEKEFFKYLGFTGRNLAQYAQQLNSKKGNHNVN